MFKTFKIISLFALFVLITSLGCVNYKYYDPTPVGYFYPKIPGTVRARAADGKLNGKSYLRQSVLLTIRQPAEISAIASATYYDENAGTYEVAKLKFSFGEYFVWTSSLREFGSIEFTSKKPIWGILSPITNFPMYISGSFFNFIITISLLAAIGFVWRALWSLAL